MHRNFRKNSVTYAKFKMVRMHVTTPTAQSFNRISILRICMYETRWGRMRSMVDQLSWFVPGSLYIGVCANRGIKLHLRL